MGSYTKTIWVDDDGSGIVGTPLSASVMNNIENWLRFAASRITLLNRARVATAAALPANTQFSTMLESNAIGVLPDVDGISLSVNDYLLVKDESTLTKNGLYTVGRLGVAGVGGQTWRLFRESFAGPFYGAEGRSLYVIHEGTANGGKLFLGDGALTIVEGTTDQTFTEITTSGGGGGGSPSRTSVTYTTASLADLASETGVVTMAKGYNLLRVVADKACRVEVYANAAYQTADGSRGIGVDPTLDHGVMLDLVMDAADLDYALSPTVDGNNLESSPDTNIPITITNRSGSTGAVAVTFHYIATES